MNHSQLNERKEIFKRKLIEMTKFHQNKFCENNKNDQFDLSKIPSIELTALPLKLNHEVQTLDEFIHTTKKIKISDNLSKICFLSSKNMKEVKATSKKIQQNSTDEKKVYFLKKILIF